MTAPGARTVFVEPDTMFSLMETALRRQLTPDGERALKYFFGPDISAPLARLTALADRLGLPPAMEVEVCPEAAALERALPAADFLVTERAPVTRRHIESGRQLKLIQKFGRDCDNIDLAAAREGGVAVASLLRRSSLSAAENVIALLLALARNLVLAHRSVLAVRDPALPPRFASGPPRTKFNWAGVRGIRVLATQSLGLIGLGEISGEIAKRAAAFGMRILYSKRHRLPAELEAEFGNARYLPLEELAAQADFISIHVPYGPATEKMIGAEFLARMKPTSFLINTARGGIIDEQALYAALRAKKIAGAALDVYRYEPIPPDCPLLDLDNVLWTPHMAGGEPEFMLQEVEDVLANLARAWQGLPPAGLVTA
jgi:phosphoglycerate dehydrogenase-like enzyme